MHHAPLQLDMVTDRKQRSQAYGIDNGSLARGSRVSERGNSLARFQAAMVSKNHKGREAET